MHETEDYMDLTLDVVPLEGFKIKGNFLYGYFIPLIFTLHSLKNFENHF